MTGDASTPAAAALLRLVSEAAGVDPDELADDTRVAGRRPDEPDGSVPASHAATVLDDAAAVVGVVPRVESSLARRLLSGSAEGVEVRLVLTGRARAVAAGSGQFALRAAVAGRDASLFVHGAPDESNTPDESGDPTDSTTDGESASPAPGDSPVALLLVDDCALIGLFDEEEVAAVLSTTDPAVREWVVATFERYRAVSSPLFG